MPTLEELFPVSLPERAVRFDVSETNPAVILENEVRRLATRSREEQERLLSVIALGWFHLGRLVPDDSDDQGAQPVGLSDGLNIVRDNLKDVLDGSSVKVMDFTGTPFNDDVQNLVDVRGHSRNDTLSEPTVVHTESPAVIRNGRTISRGAVLVESPQRE